MRRARCRKTLHAGEIKADTSIHWAVRMREGKPLSTGEIALMLGIARSTVEDTEKRALQKLRAVLSRETLAELHELRRTRDTVREVFQPQVPVPYPMLPR